MKYVREEFEAGSWLRFEECVLSRCTDCLLILRDRKGQQPYAEKVRAALRNGDARASLVDYSVLPGRARAALRYFDIRTLGELAELSADDLMERPSFGERSLRSVLDLLQSRDLGFKDKPHDRLLRSRKPTKGPSFYEFADKTETTPGHSQDQTPPKKPADVSVAAHD